MDEAEPELQPKMKSTADFSPSEGRILDPWGSEDPLLVAWARICSRLGGEAAVLSETGAVLRRFADVEAEACTWQRLFAEHGLGAGDVLAIQIGNGPEWPALVVAALRQGVVPLPLGRHIGEAERAGALELCSARAIVEKTGFGVEGAALHLLNGGCVEWGARVPQFLKLTSGTTAAPRAIRFKSAQLLEDALQICETMGFGEGDLNYAVIPLSHSYGFSNVVTPLLARGVAMAVSEDRLPRAILNGLAQTGASIFPGMPIFFDHIATMEEAPPLPRLRLCVSAGAPLTTEVGVRFTARFGLKVHTFYGSSECGGIAFEGSDRLDYPAGFVGQPMSRVRLEQGEGGELKVRSRAVADGYWTGSARGEEASELGEGVFIPGDRARWTEEGLWIEGRLSDVINIAGRKLNPLEVEEALARYPGVRQVVVIGVASRLRHEEAVACVVPEQGAAGFGEEALLRYARECLSGWQVPKAVWMLEHIPVNERGKINRRDLAKQYVEMRDSVCS